MSLYKTSLCQRHKMRKRCSLDSATATAMCQVFLGTHSDIYGKTIQSKERFQDKTLAEITSDCSSRWKWSICFSREGYFTSRALLCADHIFMPKATLYRELTVLVTGEWIFHVWRPFLFHRWRYTICFILNSAKFINSTCSMKSFHKIRGSFYIRVHQNYQWSLFTTVKT